MKRALTADRADGLRESRDLDLMRAVARSAGWSSLLAAIIVIGASHPAAAEPMFLSKQYPRCTSCHVSPTGGGLLNDFGRSMSHTVLPTIPTSDPASASALDGEQAFLFGVLGDSMDPVRLGVGLRPSHLRFDFPGGSTDRNFLMQADLQAAYQGHGLTVYGDIGRHVDGPDAVVGSYEHWVAYRTANDITVRAGRFMPAYGVRVADHTAFNRARLGFDRNDQIYGAEVSHSSRRTLVQVALGPGRAESIGDADGTRAFTTSGRVQVDLSARTVLVASGIFRGESAAAPQSGSAGVAFGLAPGSRLTLWTQADARADAGPGGTNWVVVHETAVEAYRGVWLKVSPQLQTDAGNGGGDLGRLVLSAVLLPRTHWNVNVSYYRDRNRDFRISTSALLGQLHLFL